ncbi:hypothetical protein BD769DRAFT_719645 [Suillus cothurnatus]|nr:hypothetical protein BD769DRAFT_719645 [Suillus cothurnatus]
MLDIPRDLARITSSVLRNARSTDTKGKSSEGELRRLLEYVRKLIEKHCHTKDFQDPHNRELPCQSVSAFCFLRLIVQGILHPHLFGLYPGQVAACSPVIRYRQIRQRWCGIRP